MRAASASPRSFQSDERGIALAMALLAILVIGALVTGTFFAGRMEMTSGRNAVYTAQATEAAEGALAMSTGANWNSTYNNLALGAESSTGYVYPHSGTGNSSVRYSTTVRRLKAGVFSMTATGEKLDRNGNVMASRILAKYMKLFTPSLDIQAAVTANAHVQVSGNTTKVDGFDQLPPGWTTECAAPAAGTGVYGIRTSATVGESGNPDITGTPAETKLHDNTITTSTFLDPYLALTPLANITLSSAAGTQTYTGMAPTTSGGRCNSGDTNNWGEPYRSGGYVALCTTYFPIIYYPGSGTLKLTNGRAQGIIISANNIDIAGNFEFDGIMLALGSVDTHGTGNKVSGAVLSGNANISDDDAIAGTPTILYSSCAVQTALQYSAKAVALNERSWAQINPR